MRGRDRMGSGHLAWERIGTCSSPFYASYILKFKFKVGQTKRLCYLFVTFLDQLSIADSTLSHARK